MDPYFDSIFHIVKDILMILAERNDAHAPYLGLTKHLISFTYRLPIFLCF